MSNNIEFGALQHLDSANVLLCIPPNLGSSGADPGTIAPVPPEQDNENMLFEPDVLSMKPYESHSRL
eukprot:5827400-Amphidinium_carterae.2